MLSSPDVDTVIPGVRSRHHAEAHVRAAEAGALPADLLAVLRERRDREPTDWSQ